MVDETRSEVAWNIIAEQTKFVANLIQNGIEKYLKGDIGEWFNILTAIREVIDYDLKPHEKDILDDIENDTWGKRKFWGTYTKELRLGNKVKDEVIQQKTKFVDNVKKYSRTLMDILKKLGYFPKKEDRTKLSF
jgi:hypothetical protein